MGGGLGFAANASMRIVTEKSKIAMPENKIGFFPDVRSSYFLNRLKVPGAGKWMGLTGQTISGMDAVNLGIATHFMDFKDFEVFTKNVESSATDVEFFSEIEEVVDIFYAKDNIFDIEPFSAEKINIFRAFDETGIDQNYQKSIFLPFEK